MVNSTGLKFAIDQKEIGLMITRARDGNERKSVFGPTVHMFSKGNSVSEA